MMLNTVYHYTSPDGIFNILKDYTLWFTDCQYLNDIGESIYFKEPFINAYEKITKERGKKSEIMDDFIENFFASPYEGTGISTIDRDSANAKITLGIKHHRYYVLCTSINSDTASMWNYYVKNGVFRGYNLGINRSVVNELFSHLCQLNKQVDFFEGKIIYDKDKQIELIYEKLKELFKHHDEQKGKGVRQLYKMSARVFLQELEDYINEWKLLFKNPAFSSEEEYRFILKIDNDFEGGGNLSFKFRVGESGIITPYIAWEFGFDQKRDLFKQITLAPMIESTLAEESFKRFLDSVVKKNIEIKPSSINLRF